MEEVCRRRLVTDELHHTVRVHGKLPPQRQVQLGLSCASARGTVGAREKDDECASIVDHMCWARQRTQMRAQSLKALPVQGE